MPVTFTIKGNCEFCDAHGLTRKDEVECLCLQGTADPYPKCGWCKGTGVDVITSYPYELNMANGNAATFCSALGVEPMYSEVEPQRLLDLLACLDPDLAVRGATAGVGDRGCRWFDMGLDPAQIVRYVGRLREIAREASRRGQPVVWG